MNNSEKKQFIIDTHRLYLRHQPYNGNVSLEEMKQKEDALWKDFFSYYFHLLPKSLFKYRKPTEEAISNFENDEAWFSHPEDFDDTMDSTLNNDIESELEDFEKDPDKYIKKLSLAFIAASAAKYNVKIEISQIEDGIKLFNSDGTINEIAMKMFLHGKIPANAIDACIQRLKFNSQKFISKNIKASIRGYLSSYLDMNKKVRKEVLVYSLAEESNNQAMWGLYADESKGFCVEYVFPADTLLGQRIIMNLFPIYYGEKPLINFFDVLTKGLYSNKTINGIDYDDYKEWFVSAYTKDITYNFQKEWRITFSKIMGNNLQPFPFIKSVTIGERMSKENKARIIEAAKKKNIDIYMREFNRTGSNIKIVKL